MRSTGSLICLATALMLAGCSDSVAPSRPSPVVADNTSHPPPPEHTGPYVVLLNDTNREIAEGDSVRLDVVVDDSNGMPVSEPTVEWESTDTSVVRVSLSPSPFSAVRIVAIRPGSASVLARSLGAQRLVVVTVLPRTTAAPTLVVDDFHVGVVGDMPIGSFGHWSYAPKLELHDAGPSGGSAIIGARIEIPGIAFSPWCATTREVGRMPLELFRVVDEYDELAVESSLVQPDWNAVAVAHLTVRNADGTASTLTVSGPLVPGTRPYEAPYPALAEDFLCG
jgi:hypothetical protein